MFYCHDCGRRAQYAGEGYHCVYCNSGFVEHIDGRNIGDMRGLGFPGIRILLDPAAMGLLGEQERGGDITGEHQRILEDVQAMQNRLLERIQAMAEGVQRRQPQPVQEGEPQPQEGHEQHRHRRHRLLHPRFFDLLHNRDGYHWIGPDGVGMDGDEEPVVRALTSEEISKLPSVTIDQARIDAGGGDPPQCTVCLEEMKLGGSALELVCHHVFHRDCIEPWLRKQASCPLCRRDLVHEGDGGEEDDDEYYGTDEEDYDEDFGDHSADDYDEDAYDDEDYDGEGSDMDDDGEDDGEQGNSGGGAGTSGGNA